MQHERRKVKPLGGDESRVGDRVKSRRHEFGYLLFVAVVACSVYINSLPNAFVYDDLYYVEYHPILSVETPGLLTTDFLGYGHSARYRPLTLLSFRANYLLGGFEPFGYRLVNIVLHAANTGFVYMLVLFLMQSRAAALVTALLFAVHPIHTEAVAWVSGRAELLAAFWLLASWLFYLHATAADSVHRLGFALSLFSFFLALFAKEHTVVFPAVLVLSDVYRCFARPESARKGEWARRLVSRAGLYGAYVGLIALYLIIHHLVLEKSFFIGGSVDLRVSNPLLQADVLTRLYTALKVLGYYMGLLLWPHPLSVDYSYNQLPVEPSLTTLAVLWPLAALVLLLAGAVGSFRKAPDLSFAVLFFFVTVIPVSNLVIPIGTIMAERLLYLPSLGGCLLAGCLWKRFLAWRGRGTVMRGAGYVLVGGILLVLSYRTVERNKDWRNDLTLWQSALEVSPESVIVRQNLGVALLDQGQREAALAQFREALRIYPLSTATYLKWGTLYAREGKLDQAIEVYREAAALMDNRRIFLNLGAALMRQGTLDEAIEVYRKAVATVPDARIFLNLGVALMQKGRIAEAIESYREATRLEPAFATAYYNLGNAHLRQNDFAEAIKAYQEAIALDPDYHQAYNNLAFAYQQQGDTTRAAQVIREAQSARRRRRGSGKKIEYDVSR